MAGDVLGPAQTTTIGLDAKIRRGARGELVDGQQRDVLFCLVLSVMMICDQDVSGADVVSSATLFVA